MRETQYKYAAILGALINAPMTVKQLSVHSGLNVQTVWGMIKAYRLLPTGVPKHYYVFISSYAPDKLGRCVLPRFRFSEVPREDELKPPPLTNKQVKDRAKLRAVGAASSVFNIAERITRERDYWKEKYRKRSAEGKSRDVERRRTSRSRQKRDLAAKVGANQCAEGVPAGGDD